MVQMTVPASMKEPLARRIPFSHFHGASAEPNRDAARGERAGGGGTEPRRQLGKQAIDVLQEQHVEARRADARVIAPDAGEAVGELSGHFHARETAADHDEAPEAPALGRIGLELDAPRGAGRYSLYEARRRPS